VDVDALVYGCEIKIRAATTDESAQVKCSNGHARALIVWVPGQQQAVSSFDIGEVLPLHASLNIALSGRLKTAAISGSEQRRGRGTAALA
jgi:DNA-binding IclR family transcriptional regulator